MEAAKTKSRTYYNGVYRHGMDDKRRLQIPARWRPEEAGVELTLIVWPQHAEGPCLRVLQPQQMENLMMSLDMMGNQDSSKVALKRFLGSESVQVTLDKVGRVCVPESFAKQAGITDQAVLVGLLDKFEVWSPERYERVRVSDGVRAQEALKLLE